MNKANQRGITLIETMLASVIIAVGLIGFFKIRSIALQRSLSAQYSLFAQYAASNVLAHIHAHPELLSWMEEYHSVIMSDNNKVYTAQCELSSTDINQPSMWCNKSNPMLFSDIINSVQEDLSSGFHYRSGKAALCVNSMRDVTTNIRITAIWQAPQHTNNKSELTSSHCPASYDDISEKKGYSSIDLYSEL